LAAERSLGREVSKPKKDMLYVVNGSKGQEGRRICDRCFVRYSV